MYARAQSGGAARGQEEVEEVGRTLFRRSPHLVSFWEGDRLLFENYAAGVRVAAASLVTDILHFCCRWRSFGGLVAHFDEYTESSLRTAVRTLERHLLLVRSDRRDPRDRAMNAWSSWNPAAGFFH